MEKKKSLKKSYYEIYENITSIKINEIESEHEIISLIMKINMNQSLGTLNENTINAELISQIFRSNEDSLSKLLLIDQELFEIKFKLYIYLIDLFNQLCKIYSKNDSKRKLVEPIIEALIESKTFLKIKLQLNEEKINIINNHIGQARYKFSHLSYFEIEGKDIDYVFEYYQSKCEKIVHGFELSKDSSFLSYLKNDKEIEKNIFINNLSFLLLKMHYEIKYFHPKLKFWDNPYYKKIVDFFYESTNLENIDKSLEKNFEKLLVEEFIKTSFYLEAKGISVIDEKIQLLQLNTDEYKQLIDIITSKINVDNAG
ncbi:hypothetical protein [Arcobacter arenosus]|uniref:Uncharacterized protein n=1 Tax=Arcobacter arenosus TaxID=2576037 RepID=A0A5R8Y3L7_9BACT|nr:hypothetical protein [Arcobacter arenosus]TLP39461.1 hypothetical protein FDK22_06215 [Arcobacter arenosus]